MDRIGSLPDEVLCHILSFLTTKEAALTSILSKRWRNLFTLVPNIDVDDSVFLNPEEGKRERDGILQTFMDFVDRVLASQGDSPIKKFSLKCKTGIDRERVNLWICNVLQRGVTSLDLVLDFPRDDDELDYMYFLPDEIFVSTKLVELSLRSDFGVDWWRGGRGTSLPMVKTLTFESKWILLCDELEVFLSGFPVLEEFYVAEIEWDSDESVSSDSLRKLTIYSSGFEDFRNPKSISFDTPNLVYLEYSDFVAADYPKVNLPNLGEAVLDLKVTGDQMDLIREPDGEDDVSLLRLQTVGKLIKGIRNVNKLFISAETLEVLSLCCESMPVFNNLKVLRIICDADLGWQAMPALLRNCPRLETLILKGLLHHVTDKCGDVCDCIPREDKGRSLLSCPVKKLQIIGFQGTVREKEMIRHFLESLPCLDEMEVYAAQKDDDDPTNSEVNRMYKIIAYKVHGDEVNPETVLQSTSMSQTRMEEISSQFNFTPRNNKNMYDMVYIMHGAPPPPPPPQQEMSEDDLKEKLDAANAKLAKLKEDFEENKRVHDAANAKRAKLAELDEDFKENRRVHDAMFDSIVNQNPMIASALKARESATVSEGSEASNDQEKKRDSKALLEIVAELYPDFASALRASRAADLEPGEPSGEPSRDQGEMTDHDQTTSEAVASDVLPRD